MNFDVILDQQETIAPFSEHVSALLAEVGLVLVSPKSGSRQVLSTAFFADREAEQAPETAAPMLLRSSVGRGRPFQASNGRALATTHNVEPSWNITATSSYKPNGVAGSRIATMPSLTLSFWRTIRLVARLRPTARISPPGSSPINATSAVPAPHAIRQQPSQSRSWRAPWQSTDHTVISDGDRVFCLLRLDLCDLVFGRQVAEGLLQTNRSFDTVSDINHGTPINPQGCKSIRKGRNRVQGALGGCTD